jgi:hypothetical protein
MSKQLLRCIPGSRHRNGLGRGAAAEAQTHRPRAGLTEVPPYLAEHWRRRRRYHLVLGGARRFFTALLSF